MSELPKYTIIFGIFENVVSTTQVPATPAKPSKIDPIEELKNAAGPITIDYTARFQNSNTKAFMDFSKSDRRWINHIIADIRNFGIRDSYDNVIMQGSAVRNRFSEKQNWQDVIDGMYQDKVVGGRDFSEGQMKQLATLIGLLSKGRALAGCGSLCFVEKNSGKELA